MHSHNSHFLGPFLCFNRYAKAFVSPGDSKPLAKIVVVPDSDASMHLTATDVVVDEVRRLVQASSHKE